MSLDHRAVGVAGEVQGSFEAGFGLVEEADGSLDLSQALLSEHVAELAAEGTAELDALGQGVDAIRPPALQM
jgi:hypothetical protein